MDPKDKRLSSGAHPSNFYRVHYSIGEMNFESFLVAIYNIASDSFAWRAWRKAWPRTLQTPAIFLEAFCRENGLTTASLSSLVTQELTHTLEKLGAPFGISAVFVIQFTEEEFNKLKIEYEIDYCNDMLDTFAKRKELLEKGDL